MKFRCLVPLYLGEKKTHFSVIGAAFYGIVYICLKHRSNFWNISMHCNGHEKLPIVNTVPFDSVHGHE